MAAQSPAGSVCQMWFAAAAPLPTTSDKHAHNASRAAEFGIGLGVAFRYAAFFPAASPKYNDAFVCGATQTETLHAQAFPAKDLLARR